ncbi:hypothetical protein DHB64_08055 [Antarcticibacterium sp. W02-3]|nr:hypothetical protein [Antarcticibacterium sp. W02-3]
MQFEIAAIKSDKNEIFQIILHNLIWQICSPGSRCGSLNGRKKIEFVIPHIQFSIFINPNIFAFFLS